MALQGGAGGHLPQGRKRSQGTGLYEQGSSLAGFLAGTEGPGLEDSRTAGDPFGRGSKAGGAAEKPDQQGLAIAVEDGVARRLPDEGGALPAPDGCQVATAPGREARARPRPVGRAAQDGELGQVVGRQVARPSLNRYEARRRVDAGDARHLGQMLEVIPVVELVLPRRGGFHDRHQQCAHGTYGFVSTAESAGGG